MGTEQEEGVHSQASFPGGVVPAWDLKAGAESHSNMSAANGGPPNSHSIEVGTMKKALCT